VSAEILKPNTGQGNKGQNRLEIVLLCLAPLALLLFFFATHPFKETLASRSIDLSKYSSSQRLNFLTAARALDGAVINPKGVFSFNGRVGPRQAERGFVPAPGYLEGQKQNTNGGGICLISSTLYQVALLSGLQIVERTAHTNTVNSVAPGLDATVWYGRTDLKFKNIYNAPLAINCREEGDNLSISLMGDAVTKLTIEARQTTLRRCQIACDSDSKNLLVEVFLKSGRSEHLVSRDRYRVSR
jgi:vancomycin resistance protein YoaR